MLLELGNISCKEEFSVLSLLEFHSYLKTIKVKKEVFVVHITIPKKQKRAGDGGGGGGGAKGLLLEY